MAMAYESSRNLKNELTVFHILPERMTNHLPSFVLSLKVKQIQLGFDYFICSAPYLLLITVPLILIGIVRYFDSVAVTLSSSFTFVLVAAIYVMSRPRNVYLVDFACDKPDPSQMCTRARYMQLISKSGFFTQESLVFLKKVLERSGIGNMTYSPKILLEKADRGEVLGINFSEARKEKEGVFVRVIGELLAKTGVNPSDIGVLVVNCSGFNPVPSLSATIVNLFKLRSNILSYSLGGMGCSAGPICIDLANRLLQVQPNCYALVLCTENVTQSLYKGNDRSMLMAMTLFREGDAAVLLSNKSSDRSRSKYQLVHTLRTHMGADDRSYNCIQQQEDELKIVGVKLTKDLISVAGEVLKTHITQLGPIVLPVSEKLLYVATLVARKVFNMKMKPYVPDFKMAFEHFCIHVGGKVVLDEMEKNLGLSEWDVEPSRMTLYRFGNTSSSSLFYELAYSEAKGRIWKGDRIWQIGFGSGFKCNSVVWRALKNINPALEKNPWMDEIDNFPVQVPSISPFDF